MLCTYKYVMQGINYYITYVIVFNCFLKQIYSGPQRNTT